jgi:large subunit ribosomal protein L4
MVLEAQQADPYSLLRYKKVVITKDAVAQLEEQWV